MYPYRKAQLELLSVLHVNIETYLRTQCTQIYNLINSTNKNIINKYEQGNSYCASCKLHPTFCCIK